MDKCENCKGDLAGDCICTAVDKFFAENGHLMDRLAHGVMCPACSEVAMPPLANLGKTFHWAEGHPGCVPKGRCLGCFSFVCSCVKGLVDRMRKL